MARKILIIEDEPEIQAILALSLEHAGGFETVLASDGVEGIERALQEAPDLIVLDAMMPRLNGYATCRRIKQDERLRHIPVIFLTAKTDPSEVDRAMKAGAAGWVAKPFDPLRLAGQITEIADKGAEKGRYALHHRRCRIAG
jgi:CheY-like chemotaxis protein